MEDHKGVKTGLEGEGDGQTSCLWAYLVDLAHSYNFLSASRAQPDLPGNQAWSRRPSMLSNMQPPLGLVEPVKVIAVVVAASTVQEAQFQGLAGFSCIMPTHHRLLTYTPEAVELSARCLLQFYLISRK